MMDNDLCVVGTSVAEATKELLAKMMEKKGEDASTITLFYGDEVKEEDAESLLHQIEAQYPQVECMYQSGGQSLYYYYIAVE